MFAIQIGLIVFLLFILAIIYQDECRKKRLARKTAKANRFWDSGKERREQVRINTEVDVFYEVASGRKTQKRTSISKNISLGGINLALNEKLLPGTDLSLQLNLPQGAKPIFVQGKIAWVKEIPERLPGQEKEERFFATGIKFAQMSPRDEGLLRSFIDQHIKSTVRPN